MLSPTGSISVLHGRYQQLHPAKIEAALRLSFQRLELQAERAPVLKTSVADLGLPSLEVSSRSIASTLLRNRLVPPLRGSVPALFALLESVGPPRDAQPPRCSAHRPPQRRRLS